MLVDQLADKSCLWSKTSGYSNLNDFHQLIFDLLAVVRLFDGSGGLGAELDALELLFPRISQT